MGLITPRCAQSASTGSSWLTRSGGSPPATDRKEFSLQIVARHRDSANAVAILRLVKSGDDVIHDSAVLSAPEMPEHNFLSLDDAVSVALTGLCGLVLTTGYEEQNAAAKHEHYPQGDQGCGRSVLLLKSLH